MTEQTEIPLQPFSITDVDLFSIDLNFIKTENEPVYNPMITFFVHTSDGELQHCFTLTTQIVSGNPLEATQLAMQTAFNFTSDFISEITIYDEDGETIDDMIDFDLDDIYESFCHECE